MWVWGVIALLIGVGCLVAGSRLETDRKKFYEADVKMIDGARFMVHQPMYVTEDEMRALGWIPANDGSGMWLFPIETDPEVDAEAA